SFPVRTRNGDGIRFQNHQLRQHLGTRNDRNALLFRINDLRIIFADGRRINDDLRIADVFGPMAFFDANAEKFFEAVGVLGAFDVRSADGKTEIRQHLGDAAHADAADAYEMNFLNVSEHLVFRLESRLQAASFVWSSTFRWLLLKVIPAFSF